MMYERMTDRARKVMQLANQEAQWFNHEYVGPEHILLGLIKEGSGVGAAALKNLDVDIRKVRLEVAKLVQSGPEMVKMGKLPLTPRATKVIEYAMEESRNIGHNCLGTEHLCLGLLRDPESVACQVLNSLGVTLESVRSEVHNMLGLGDDEEVEDESDCPLDGICQQLKQAVENSLQQFGVELSADSQYVGTFAQRVSGPFSSRAAAEHFATVAIHTGRFVKAGIVPWKPTEQEKT